MVIDESKLTEILSFRVSKSIKEMHKKLSDADKLELNMRLRIEVARKIHETNFDPKVYLEM